MISATRPKSCRDNFLILRLVVVVVQLLSLLSSITKTTTSALSSKQIKFNGGAGVGKFVIDSERASQSDMIQCHYDMVLVERIQERTQTDSGLFVPQQDLPRLHLCRVIAHGPGKEEENGRIVPITDIHVDDIIIAKNPWGIGPRDEETTDGKKLSYMRYQDIAAIISNGIPLEDDDE